MSKSKKELIVNAIKNGTVIDHIAADKVFKVIRVLGLDKTDEVALFGVNLDSKKHHKKGIIKVRNKFFEDEEINRIGLFAPNATLITIKDYEVVNKRNVELPLKISNFVKCMNPNCVTNIENITTKFDVIKNEKEEVSLHCHYCEKSTKQNQMEFLY